MTCSSMKSLCLLLLLSLILFSCSDEEEPSQPTPDTPDMMIDGTTWTGSTVTFTKVDEADPTDSANQDRLTDKVIITRGNDGGQIFNIATESGSNKTSSPVGTAWAKGRTSDLPNLTFAPFRETVGQPKDVVGQDLVLHLIDDNIYLNVNFTQWTQGKAGGFAYQRASE